MEGLEITDRADAASDHTHTHTNTVSSEFVFFFCVLNPLFPQRFIPYLSCDCSVVRGRSLSLSVRQVISFLWREIILHGRRRVSRETDLLLVRYTWNYFSRRGSTTPSRNSDAIVCKQVLLQVRSHYISRKIFKK